MLHSCIRSIPEALLIRKLHFLPTTTTTTNQMQLLKKVQVIFTVSRSTPPPA